jgi:hypothetical protein
MFAANQARKYVVNLMLRAHPSQWPDVRLVLPITILSGR